MLNPKVLLLDDKRRLTRNVLFEHDWFIGCIESSLFNQLAQTPSRAALVWRKGRRLQVADHRDVEKFVQALQNGLFSWLIVWQIGGNQQHVKAGHIANQQFPRTIVHHPTRRILRGQPRAIASCHLAVLGACIGLQTPQAQAKDTKGYKDCELKQNNAISHRMDSIRQMGRT